MDVEAAARRWAATWRAAWPARDEDAVVGLYAEDAVYLSHPFREPHLGTTVLRFRPDGRVEEHRDYWTIQDGRRLPPPGWGR